MTKDDPASSPEFQEYLRRARKWPQFLERVGQVSERLESWHQQSANLKKPEETLRLEKERLEFELQKARYDAHGCLQDADFSDPTGVTPDHHNRLDVALDRVSSCVAQLTAFERDYGRKAKGLQKIYMRQVKELKGSFPIPDNLIPEDVFGASPAHSPEPEPSVEGPEKAAENALSSSENGRTITEAGPSIVTDGVASSSGTEQVTVSQHIPDLVIPCLPPPR